MQKDIEFSQHIRERDNHRCKVCGSTYLVQCAHLWSRRHLATRWDTDNALTLCGDCHYRLDRHKSKLHELFRAWLGVERYEALRVRHLEISK